MNASMREKIWKSWAGVSEVQLIKEVATKGEHIQLCVEYWARKRKMPVPEYQLFFHDVVQTYVQRLLTERLVYKAENVLRNVQRDVKCCYFQFACECGDQELQEVIIDYLRKGDPHQCERDLQEMRFYWDLLQQLKDTPTVMANFKPQLRRHNIDMLMALPSKVQKRLMVELYFANRNSVLLQRLSKFNVWEFLVETQRTAEMVLWCGCSHKPADGASERGDEASQHSNDLHDMFRQWTLEPEMFEHALKTLEAPTEALSNCFASRGYFFAQERDSVPTVLRRICTTGSFTINRELMDKLAIGRFLLERAYYPLMLQAFVSSRELQELAEESTDQEELLKFIVALKDNKLEERQGFEKIAQATKVYLERRGVDFQHEQPLVTFHEFLNNEPSIANLNCFLLSSALKYVPYLKSLAHRLDPSANRGSNFPTPYDLLRKFGMVDFKEICKDGRDVPSFSNERLCEKYARKYHLNYLHHLKQQRSAYAVYYLLTEKLQHYAQITNAQLFSACETVTELALQHASSVELVTHAVAFIEMLGFDTQHLRVFLKLCRTVDCSDCVPSYGLLMAHAEQALSRQLQVGADVEPFPLAEYQALMRISACNQHRQWPDVVLRYFAGENNWWRLLVLLQYFDVPLHVLQQLVEHFEVRTVGEHLLRALSHEPAATDRSAKRHASFSRQQKTRKQDNNTLTTSIETVTSSSVSSYIVTSIQLKASHSQELGFLTDSEGRLDLFAIILLSKGSGPEDTIADATKFLAMIQDNSTNVTSLNLLKNCIKFRLPVLSLLSATVYAGNVHWNWLVWLGISTDQWQDVVLTMQKEDEDFAWFLIENCVRVGCTATLYRSFCIFHEDNTLKHLMKFLHRTQNHRDFSDEMVHELRLYLLAWSNDLVEVPLGAASSRERLMQRSIKLLLLHLEQNFSSTLDQQKLLAVICKSDMSDISALVDFCLLKEIFTILQNVSGWAQRFPIQFEALLLPDNKIYEQLLSALLEAKEYHAAIRLASLLHLPICDIVYTKWVADIEADVAVPDMMLQRYEDEIVEHSLPPEILVNFFLYAASRLEHSCTVRRYQLLKRALNVIKRNHLFPNESFDRDQIEYDMTVAYLQIEDSTAADALEIYHSEYYEQIMLHERCVLYKSFLELKELAGIEDLNANPQAQLTEPMKRRLEALLNRLLDEGDIVEALRLQELFECRPIDLRFVVFCMALAEGVTTIFNMSAEERHLLRDVEKSSFAKFNKRTLSTIRTTMTHPPGYSSPSSPLKLNNELSDSCSTLEFEEIPSKEKRETLDMIQGIASKLKHGINMGKRILMAYRAAMYLDKEYLDVLRTKDVAVLLKSVAEEECLHRLLVVSDILASTHMTSHEIAELLAFEITTAVVRPRFYIFSADQHTKNTFTNADLWGYNIDRDLHLFLELMQNTTQLGSCLLDYCDALKAYRKYQDNKPYEHNGVFEKLAEIITRYGLPAATPAPPTATATAPPQVLSHKKQNLIYVELLIKAHQCFVHECSMEGISNVLHRAKSLNVVLARAKSWSLIVRMLIGIARYREMFYCFDTLIENDQFESLLGQFDEDKTVGLRQAILTYLREYCPANAPELLKLAALHFRMYKDLAEIWEQDAQTLLDKVLASSQVGGAQLTEQLSMASLTTAVSVKTIIPKIRSSPHVLDLLLQALENFTHATENYLLDNKLLLAQKSAGMAELVAMQIDLANRAQDPKAATQSLCVCVLKLQTQDEIRELINAELSVPQAIIVGRAYGHDINWSEALLFQYVIQRRSNYLAEYLKHFFIHDTIIDSIVKGFQYYSQYHAPSAEMEESVAQLVGLVKSITLKYKLASLLTMKRMVTSLINDQTLYYLRDTNYGRSERQNIPDI